MNLEQLKQKQIEQLDKKGWRSGNKEIALHLAEEVGEVCEAIRENKSRQECWHMFSGSLTGGLMLRKISLLH